MKKLSIYLTLLLLALFTSQCDKNNEIHIFGIQTDKDFGLKTDSAIRADPAQFPILDKSKNQAAYTYLESMVSKILNSGQVTYKDEFAWQVTIIDDSKLSDRVLNAFATPGGYIYVYSGLIKYLDKEDDLAGVIGHEIAHADRRHSISQIEKSQGLSVITSIILGKNPSKLKEIVGGLAGTLATLQFSRSDENEADEYSVKYLGGTNYYACNGAASFFDKLLKEGQAGGTPEFLSTHPSPANRVEDINKQAQERGCKTSPVTPSTYNEFKSMLP